MRRHPRLCLALLAALACCQLSACALLRKKPPQKPAPVGQATLIGMIEMVNPEQNYVVIRCDTPPSIRPGTELLALSAEGSRSKLILSPERKGFYLTADIKEGTPTVTNLVLLPNEAAVAAAEPSPPTPSPTAPASEPAQAIPPTPLPAPQQAQAAAAQVPAAAAVEKAPDKQAVTPLKLDDLEPPVGNP